MHIIAHNCTLSFISNYEQKKIMQNFLLKLHIMLKYNLYTLNDVLIYMQHTQYIIFLWLYIYIIFIKSIIFVIIFDLHKCEIISDMIKNFYSSLKKILHTLPHSIICTLYSVSYTLHQCRESIVYIFTTRCL